MNKEEFRLWMSKTVEEIEKELARVLQKAELLMEVLKKKEEKPWKQPWHKVEPALIEAFEIVASGWPQTIRGKTSHLPVYAWHVLMRAGIFSLSQLREKIETGQEVRNIGEATWSFLLIILQTAEQKASP